MSLGGERSIMIIGEDPVPHVAPGHVFHVSRDNSLNYFYESGLVLIQADVSELLSSWKLSSPGKFNINIFEELESCPPKKKLKRQSWVK